MKNVRVARSGDVCVLLEPSKDELADLRKQQALLQTHFGGRFHKNIHLTCQRFKLPGTLSSIELMQHLQTTLIHFQPFPIVATSLDLHDSPFWRSHLLRWNIQPTEEICSFATCLTRSLKAINITPHYDPAAWPTAAHVTALEAVTTLDLHSNPFDHEFPLHLFIAQRIVLSKINGRDAFEIVGQAQLHAQYI